jgi:hypothetical protein
MKSFKQHFNESTDKLLKSGEFAEVMSDTFDRFVKTFGKKKGSNVKKEKDGKIYSTNAGNVFAFSKMDKKIGKPRFYVIQQGSMLEQAQTERKTVWDVYDERDHYWPMLKDWQEVDWDKCDRFNTCASISYQDHKTGVIVNFDASALQQGGKGPGVFDYEYWGRKVTGKFKRVDNLKNVVRSIQKMLPKVKDKQIKSIPKSIAGFTVERLGDSDNDIAYTRNLTNDLLANFNLFDIGEVLAGGRGEAMAGVDDHGGYERAVVFTKNYMVNGIKDLPKQIKQFLKDIAKAGINF